MLKAVWQNIPFRFVHDIAELLTVLEQRGISLPEQIRATAELFDYAVEARYPAPIEPVTEDEYKEAVAIGETVVSWVENPIGSTTERTTDNWPPTTDRKKSAIFFAA